MIHEDCTDGAPPAKQVWIMIYVKGSQAQLYSAIHDQYFSEMADRSLPDFQQFEVENVVDGPFDTGNYYMLSFLYLLNRTFSFLNFFSASRAIRHSPNKLYFLTF